MGKWKKRTMRARIVELNERGMRAHEIADEVGCYRYEVFYVLRLEEQERYAEGRRRCVRCGFLDEERNPVGEDRVCLWCRLEEAGVDLLDYHESGMAMEVVGGVM